jgi:hypothetical protein
MIGHSAAKQKDLEVTSHNLALEAALRLVLGRFAEEDIPVVVLKGLPMLRRLPGGLKTRRLADNDLLVRRRDVLRAYGALLTLGYRPHPHLEIESQLHASREYALFHPSGAIVDLHWSAFPPELFDAPEELQWNHTEVVELGGTKARVFDHPMTLVHLASHMVQHRLSEMHILVELSQLFTAWHPTLSEAELLSVARQAGARDALAYCLSAALELGYLKAAPTAELLDSARARLLARLVPPSALGVARPSPDYVRTIQCLLVANPARLHLWLRRHFAPPLDNLSAVYDEPTSPVMYLRYFTRLFRPVARTLTKR